MLVWVKKHSGIFPRELMMVNIPNQNITYNRNILLSDEASFEYIETCVHARHVWQTVILKTIDVICFILFF